MARLRKSGIQFTAQWIFRGDEELILEIPQKLKQAGDNARLIKRECNWRVTRRRFRRLALQQESPVLRVDDESLAGSATFCD